MKSISKPKSIGIAVVVASLTTGVIATTVSSRAKQTAPIVLQDPVNHAPLTPPAARTAPSTPISAAPAVVPPTQTPAIQLAVHLTGAVHKPGVYHLPADSRIEDAIKQAGGALDGADLQSINLAAHVEDGSQIRIPLKSEKPAEAPPANPEDYVKHDPTTAHKDAAAAKHGSAKSDSSRGGASSDKLTASSKETINLNKATSEELQKLPGIGPAMAERILAYRKESGGFQSIEEMMQVKGIGAKKFAKMEKFLRVK